MRAKLAKSGMLCHHANETPRGACLCPRDCPCRETMCPKRSKPDASQRSRLVCESRNYPTATTLRMRARKFWDLPEPVDDSDTAGAQADRALRTAALEYAEACGYQPPGQAHLMVEELAALRARVEGVKAELAAKADAYVRTLADRPTANGLREAARLLTAALEPPDENIVGPDDHRWEEGDPKATLPREGK